MESLPTADVVRRRQTSMDRAAAVLNTHTSTPDGLCAGCLQIWNRWVPATGCTQLAWARLVIETHGVEAGAWGVVTSRLGAAVLV